jgi:hypothetical protein
MDPQGQCQDPDRMLSPEQVDDYRSWFWAEKHLRALVYELEDLGL